MVGPVRFSLRLDSRMPLRLTRSREPPTLGAAMEVPQAWRGPCGGRWWQDTAREGPGAWRRECRRPGLLRTGRSLPIMPQATGAMARHELPRFTPPPRTPRPAIPTAGLLVVLGAVAALGLGPATPGAAKSWVSWTEARAHRGQLVRLRGPVTAVERTGKQVHFTIGQGDNEVVVIAAAPVAKAFPSDLAKSFEGQEVEVVGFVEGGKRPKIELASADQIRVVAPPAKPDVESRLRALAARIDRLEAQVEKLQRLVSGPGRSGSRTYGPSTSPERALAVGMTAAEVRARRGLPDRIDRRRDGETWWYGRERLEFDAQRRLIGERRGG